MPHRDPRAGKRHGTKFAVDCVSAVVEDIQVVDRAVAKFSCNFKDFITIHHVGLQLFTIRKLDARGPDTDFFSRPRFFVERMLRFKIEINIDYQRLAICMP